MFSKENGITVLGVCLITEILNLFQTNISEKIDKPRTSNLKPSVARHKANCDRRKMTIMYLTLTTIMLISVRLYMMGGTNGTPSFASADNPAAAEKSFLTRSLTFAYLPSFNIVHLLMCPNELSFDWSMEAIPLIKSICDIRNVSTLLTASVISFYAFKVAKNLGLNNANLLFEPFLGTKSNGMLIQRSTELVNKVVIVSLGIMILPFIPASNIFFYVGFVVAERVLYIPSMGYCILVGYGLSHLWKIVCNLTWKGKSESERNSVKDGLVIKVLKFQIVLLTCVMCLTFGVKTICRNNDWLDEESLYRSGITINPPKGTEIVFCRYMILNKNIMCFCACIYEWSKPLHTIYLLFIFKMYNIPNKG